MNILEIAHLIFLAIWLILIAYETFVEFRSKKVESLVQASKIHFWIDIWLELPVVLGVFITGILLVNQVPMISNLLMIKIVLGLIAIVSNLYCAFLVFRRYKIRNDAAKVLVLSQKIHFTWIAVIPGLSALYIGLRYFLNLS